MKIHPQHVSTVDIRQLQNLSDALARDFGAALSGLLQTPVDVRTAGVTPMAYGRFTRSLPTLTCFYVLSADPPDERWMLDLSPSILHPIIDRMLGGPVAEGAPPHRPLTEIESSLAARVVRLFLQTCRSAWSESSGLHLDLLRMEHNPRPARILPDDEPVVVVDFELALGDLRGAMRFCLPCRFVERYIPSPHMSSTVTVTLAETSLGADALADLRPGDIIATETPIDSPASVSIDGAVRFHGKPGAYRGRKAVRLTEMIARPAEE